jgi:tetraspanin-9
LTSVVLILSLQLLVSVFAIVYRQPVTNSIRDELLVTVKTLYRPNNAMGSTWDHVHQQFQCCGIDSYSDWYDAEAWPKEKFVPDSCCLNTSNSTDCGRTMDPSTWQKQGCLAQIQLWILEQLHILASAVITLVFLQLYGIIASTLLFYHTKKPKPKNPKAFKSYPYERARM